MKPIYFKFLLRSEEPLLIQVPPLIFVLTMQSSRLLLPLILSQSTSLMDKPFMLLDKEMSKLSYLMARHALESH
jgi:hypothetical protein